MAGPSRTRTYIFAVLSMHLDIAFLSTLSQYYERTAAPTFHLRIQYGCP